MIRYPQLRLALQSGREEAGKMAEVCLQKLSHFSATPELFRVLAKFVSGELPHEWAREDLVKTWPKSFDPSKHLFKAAEAAEMVIRQIVAPYSKDPDDGRDNELQLRRIDGDQIIAVDPIEFVRDIDLPPLSSAAHSAPAFAILAGLSEIVRNAVKAVTDKSKRGDINRSYGKLHLDYRIAVDLERSEVIVSIWNPFAGQGPQASETISRMVTMYQRLGAVEVTPANMNTPHPLIQDNVFGYSEFVFRPKKLRFARAD